MVVYRPFPTSNHNSLVGLGTKAGVVYRPFPTSNHNMHAVYYFNFSLYIVRFLHQTTTYCEEVVPSDQLYIVRFLHQTTTPTDKVHRFVCCISSVSYIKPQLVKFCKLRVVVVYRPFPTSNHNYIKQHIATITVVYRPFPTSNHNCKHSLLCAILVVYRPFPTSNHNRQADIHRIYGVVYRPFPTSNHNT